MTSSPPPGVWLSDLVCSTFPKSVQSFQQPFPCPPSGVQASASLVFSALSPDPNLPHRRCSPVPVFAVSLLPPPSSSSTKLESLGCASLSFFREHSSNKSCAIFHFVRSFIRPPPINRDRQQQLDRRQTVDTTSSTSTKLLFSSIQHTHTLVLSFYSPDCFVEPPPQDPTIPTPGLQTSCRHPIPSPSPSTDRRSIALPPFARAQRHQHRARPHFCFSTSNLSTCFRQKSAR